MIPRTFSEYVADLDDVGDRVATISRRFLKVERLTHAELKRAAHRAANYLREAGVAHGDRVMIMGANSPEWVQVLLGSLVLGAVAVPVDATSTPAALERMIMQTNPTVIFVGRDLDVDTGSIATRVIEEIATYAETFAATAPQITLDDLSPALIVFTSGTTADPKGVVLTHRNVLSNIDGILDLIDVRDSWRFLSVLPLSHTYELTATLALFSHGASVVYLPRVTPLAISEALVDFEITSMLAIPQLLTLMLERIEQGAKEEGKARSLETAMRIAEYLPFGLRRVLFHSVHARLGGRLALFITGGAPIPIDVAAGWEKMGVRTLQGYGLTETSPILTCNPLGGERLDSPGRALDNVQLRIAPDGEIQAKGPSVFGEYWQSPEATREAFTDDGWFRTGDVGRLEGSWLHIEGRIKFAIVRSSGLKVFPEDVELIAEKDPRLGFVCVVGVKGDTSESVVAVVISKETDDIVEEAIASINAQLASFQHVDSWRRWPESDFPRTRLLKIDRRQVQDWANASGPAPPVPRGVAAANDDPVVRAIRLALDEPAAAVGDADRLGDLGLDSLLRLGVVATLEERLGISIADERVTPETTVGDLRTLAEMGSPTETAASQANWTYWRGVRVVGNALRDWVVQPFVRHWVTLNVEGIESLAQLESPALFIFNHSDDFDGPVIYQSLPREVRGRLAVATGADVMHDHKVLAFIVRLCFAGFSFARSEPYLPSLEYVGEMVDRGWNVLIAPEGHLSASGELQPFRSGIGLLAVNLGVPVVPMKTIGLFGTVPLHAKWPRKRSRVTVRIGAPLTFGPRMDYEEVTETLHRAVQEL